MLNDVIVVRKKIWHPIGFRVNIFQRLIFFICEYFPVRILTVVLGLVSKALINPSWPSERISKLKISRGGKRLGLRW